MDKEKVYDAMIDVSQAEKKVSNLLYALDIFQENADDWKMKAVLEIITAQSQGIHEKLKEAMEKVDSL